MMLKTIKPAYILSKTGRVTSQATDPLYVTSNSTSASAKNGVIKKQRYAACPCPNCTSNVRSYKKRQHNCHFIGCDKVFWNPSKLQSHLKTHTGENISNMIFIPG